MISRGSYNKSASIERTPEGKLYRGSQIRVLRTDRNIPLAVFSRIIEVGLTVTSKVENNRIAPTNDFLLRGADVLGIDVIDLLKAPLHPRIGRDTRMGEILLAKLRELDQRSRFARRLEGVLNQANLPPQLRNTAEEMMIEDAKAVCKRLQGLN